MRRSLIVLLTVVAVLIGFTGPANAGSAAVDGTGDITKMVANNKSRAVLVKLYGPGGKNNVRWLNTTMKGTDGVKYTAQAGWYGADWQKSLSKGTKLVTCEKLAISYNSTGGFWRVFVPRSCLTKLTSKIKVRAELLSNASTTGGEAGWTRWIKRG